MEKLHGTNVYSYRIRNWIKAKHEGEEILINIKLANEFDFFGNVLTVRYEIDESIEVELITSFNKLLEYIKEKESIYYMISFIDGSFFVFKDTEYFLIKTQTKENELYVVLETTLGKQTVFKYDDVVKVEEF